MPADTPKLKGSGVSGVGTGNSQLLDHFQKVKSGTMELPPASGTEFVMARTPRFVYCNLVVVLASHRHGYTVA